jgi:hypothetical protein
VSDVAKVNIALRRADALVQQALMDLLTRLETEIDVPGATQDEIDAARADVARDMGW